MPKKLTIAQAKKSLGTGKGTGHKGWFGSKARNMSKLSSPSQQHRAS